MAQAKIVCVLEDLPSLTSLDLGCNCMSRGRYAGATELGHPKYAEDLVAMTALG